jgi:hypothetical protein
MARKASIWPTGAARPPLVLTLHQSRRALIWAMTDDEEKQLRQELLVADLSLRRKQDIWEHPRNIALLVAATAAIAGAVGFKIGQTPAPPPIIVQVPAK